MTPRHPERNDATSLLRLRLRLAGHAIAPTSQETAAAWLAPSLVECPVPQRPMASTARI